jgi:polyisoprenoid-binding protein YceI
VPGETRVREQELKTGEGGAAATAKINRKDFGVNGSRTLDGGGPVVRDEVSITLDVEFVQKTQ